MMGDDSWLDITSQTNNSHQLSSKFQLCCSKLLAWELMGHVILHYVSYYTLLYSQLLVMSYSAI